MTDLERLRGSAARPLPPRGGAAAARERARRRLGRIATAASSGLVVVAVLASRAASGGAHGLDVVAPVPPTPPVATASAAPSTTPAAFPASNPTGGSGPVAPTSTSPVPSVGTTADTVAPTTGPPSQTPAASGHAKKLADGENMPRAMADRGAGACTGTQERSQTFCGAVTATVGADRVVTITTEVCAAGVNTSADALTYAAELETDVVVRDGGTELWRWSRGKSWERTPHTLPIEAGQCYVWTATWQPVDGAGAPLPAGTYDVMGLSTADEVRGANTWSDTIVLP